MAEGQQTSQERIGEFLVKIGAMSPEQRAEVLEQQKKEPNRLFGEIAVELGYINDAAVDTFLGRNK
ncbi:MAG: hypothetical protein LC641_11585 [Spirochaeta sp.]|nr:hypothetical protein [Spirochaeta sp.]